MKITQETTEPTSRCVVDLERNFETRQDAIEFILTSDILSNPTVLNELYESDSPEVRIRFTIAGTYSLLGISWYLPALKHES